MTTYKQGRFYRHTKTNSMFLVIKVAVLSSEKYCLVTAVFKNGQTAEMLSSIEPHNVVEVTND